MAEQGTAIAAILRRPQVEAATGKRRSTLYQDVKEGLLTKPVRLSARAVGWPAGEIEALNRARISGADDNAIRQLVAQLHRQRNCLAPEV